MSNSDPIRILCMEDDEGLALLIKKRLERKGFIVDIARDGEEGIIMFEGGSYDLVAVDHEMPVYNGLEVIRILNSRDEPPPTIMITGVGNENLAVEAMKMGVGDYIVKDIEGGYIELVPSVIERVLKQEQLAIEKRQAEEALKRAKDELELRVKERTIELDRTNEELGRELTEKTIAEERLMESEKRLRFLSSQLMTAQERERKRISQELHDSIGQSLTSIKLRVENIFSALRERDEGFPGGPQKTVISLIQDTIEEVRKIVMGLRPSTLDDLGILATLSWFFREFQTTYPNIKIKEEINIKEDEVPVDLKIVIYRVIQEALNNVAKHSDADLVSLSLSKSAGMIVLSIKDNGSGFDLKEALSLESSKTRFGLTSMRERTELSGGSFSIDSRKGEGTVIRAVWPL